MTDHLRYYIIIIWVVITGLTTRAQVSDAGLWMSVNIEKKLNPVISLCFTEEVRMYENITEVGEVYSDIGLDYRFAKRFKVSANYRFIRQKRLDDTYKTRHRYYFDFSYKEKLKPVSLIARVRYMSQDNDLFLPGEGSVPKDHIAPKLTIKYNPGNRIEPYASAEFFFRVNDPAGKSFDQSRITAGLGYTITRMHALDLHYSITNEYNVKYPENDYVIGVGYFLTF
jgi:hypothetical protein